MADTSTSAKPDWSDEDEEDDRKLTMACDAVAYHCHTLFTYDRYPSKLHRIELWESAIECHVTQTVQYGDGHTTLVLCTRLDRMTVLTGLIMNSHRITYYPVGDRLVCMMTDPSYAECLSPDSLYNTVETVLNCRLPTELSHHVKRYLRSGKYAVERTILLQHRHEMQRLQYKLHWTLQEPPTKRRKL